MPILSPDDHKFFADNGYLHVKGVVSKSQCDAVIAAIFQFLEMDPEDPEDWYRLPLTNGGMIEMYQHQAMWNNRQDPRLYQVFAELLGIEKLWVSLDRVNLKPPSHPNHPEYEHKGFIHWDADTTNMNSTLEVQGVLYLADTDEDMGGFCCIPGFHKDLNKWIATQPADRNVRQPDMTNLKAVPIPGKAGDLVIWNKYLAHGNGHNLSTKPRLAQFITMGPAQMDNEELRQKRVDAWQNRTTVPGLTYFFGDDRRWEWLNSETAELTPLGRKLLGADGW